MTNNPFSYLPGRDYEAHSYVTDDFAYDLPSEYIAQAPADPRDSCRLLVLDRQTQHCEHRVFSDIVDLLTPRDLLVVNDTRVLPARLHMTKAQTGGAVEVLLLKRIDQVLENADDQEGGSAAGGREDAENAEVENPDAEQLWECLAKPGRNARSGQHLVLDVPDLGVQISATVREERVDGVRLIAFECCEQTFSDAIHAVGKLPLPPYITHGLDDQELYQTVYADDEHSAAAPTAGLHFTQDLLGRIQGKGVAVKAIRLDVGLDTFRPVAVDDPCNHSIHTEYVHVAPDVVDAIIQTKRAGGRVVAVGTTTARALETAYQASRSAGSDSEGLDTFAGTSGLFIVPGYRFGIVDALITNFHVPRSTLMMMVSAFATHESIRRAYDEALAHDYRFLSFGDGMLIQ